MPGGVGIFSAESGPESVDVRQCARKGLTFELTTDGEVSAFAEKICLSLVVNVPFEAGHTEHLACALTIAGRDDRRMDVNEIPFLEELMDCKGEPAPHPKYRTVHVGTRPQVSNRTQKLRCVALFLQRVGRICCSDQIDFGGSQFPFLPLSRGSNELARDCRGRSGGEVR